ncbi:MAG: hypothetical protein HY399_04095 [Elusimicrobia bacterium]|nr:hypothetical protein [Elusimicrobiota bacterium]
MSEVSVPELLRHSSNVLHVVEGVFFSLVALAALVEIKTSSLNWRRIWSLFLLVGGAFLAACLIFQKETSQISRAWLNLQASPMRVQHIAVAVLLFVAGGYELILLRRPDLKTIGYFSGLLLMVVGVLFCVHVQKGAPKAVAYSLLYHRAVGLFFILAGISRMAQRATHKISWNYAWTFFLLLCGFLMATYREPSGAFEPQRVSFSSEDMKSLLQ